MTTSDQLRQEAADAYRQREESFQRSDTDGFLSQWASGLTGQLKHTQADLLDAGGVSDFPGLFDRESGERVKAKIVQVSNYFGDGMVSKWIVLDKDDKAVEWLPAYKGESKRSKLWQQGYEERPETAPAKAKIAGSGRGLSGNAWVTVYRTDGGYPQGARTIEEIRA
jgi:hypothetical protein